LNEVFKILKHAGARDFKCIRVGTSGGVRFFLNLRFAIKIHDKLFKVGVKPGTVVVSSGAVDNQLQQKFVQHVGENMVS
jgi:uridine phosphorylase